VLKFKKVFLLGLLVVAVSCLTMSCESDPEDPKGYLLSVTGASISGKSGTSAIFNEGDNVTVTANVPHGKIFDDWTVTGLTLPAVDRTKPSITFAMPANDVTVTANFNDADEEYTVEIIGGTMTYYDGTPVVGNKVYKGDTIVITATVPEGKLFDGWIADVTLYDDGVTPTTFIMPGRDVTVVATFINEDGHPEGYTAKIVNGEIYFYDEEEDEVYITEDGGIGIFYQHDILITVSAEPQENQVFLRWDVTPAIYNTYFWVDEETGEDDRYNPDGAAFFMPASNVVITAVFGPPPVDGQASVRFTWEQAESGNITHISASENDMQWWYDEVYMDEGNVDEDFTDVPLHQGSAMLPDGLLTPQNAENNPNKSTYFEIDAGTYTAVCGVEDEFGLAEIVANYTITINEATATTDGADKFFEIAFDVGTFLAGEDDLGWFGDEYDNPNTDPRLQKLIRKGKVKVVTKKFEKAGATMDVTFYVVRRVKA